MDNNDNKAQSAAQQTQQQSNNAAPAATGEPAAAGKTFTQEEVNAIIRDRLARERAKTDQPDKSKEQEISAREAKLDCREYIDNKGYPKELLNLFDTSNIETFKGSVENLIKAFPSIVGTKATGGTGSPCPPGGFNFPRQRQLSKGKDPVSDAFGLNK